jgi:DNA-binding response OmpR family regulator
MARHARILAVDDDPEILSAVTEFLESQGYDASPRRAPHQALRLFVPDTV